MGDLLKLDINLLSPLCIYHSSSCLRPSCVCPIVFLVVSNILGTTVLACYLVHLDKQPKKILRQVKEAIWFRKTKTKLNRDLGNYELPHVYDDVIRH